ncbi:uncharacterized protein LOC127583638 isoform X1 [Pristis pectinata]|uniref:uncharacterized protein LOC127583638 isoform X1 n=1 Tax=Pristis pectinata TaxID=685728 RepID=UPI00223CE81F|nr:uncharacterized protein LOC127583638 isoform X1 [Pristis pectinata]
MGALNFDSKDCIGRTLTGKQWIIHSRNSLQLFLLVKSSSVSRDRSCLRTIQRQETVRRDVPTFHSLLDDLSLKYLSNTQNEKKARTSIYIVPFRVSMIQDGSVNTRGVIIAICLLLLVIVSLAVLFTLYYRRGRCFKRPKLKFSQNILRELTLIQLEFDPPFTVSGMMKTMGNRGSDQQFQYHNMRTREEDFSQANE